MEFPAELPDGAVVTEVRGHVLVIGINRPSSATGSLHLVLPDNR